MLENGFVKLHRSLLHWEWYDDLNTKSLFLHLLLTVNYEDAKWQGVIIKKGSRVTSYAKLSSELHLTIKQIRTCLQHLIKTGEVAYQNNSQYGVVTIVNWEKFQSWADETADEGQSNGQSEGRQGADEGQLRNKANKVKEDIIPPIPKNNKPKKESAPKEEIPKIAYAEYVNMTEAEYNKLIEKYGKDFTTACIEKLNYSKGSNGKTYKNDYLAILNWVVDEVKKKIQPKQAKPKYKSV